MTFAELGVVFAQDEAMMGKSGRFKSQRPIEHDLQSRVGQMIFTADHMRNRHKVIVDDNRKVVGGHTVGADDDEIAHGFTFKLDRSPDQIVKFDTGLRHFKTIGWFSTLRRKRFTLFAGQIAAFTHIARHPFA